jgi:penicillin-binding protein 2
LGSPTGVSLLSEAGGLVPGLSWKKKKRESWYDGDTINMVIGQGALLVTPIQMAFLMAAVANNGTAWKPLVARRVIDNQVVLAEWQPEVRGRVELPEKVWQDLHEAVIGVVDHGTARRAYFPGLVSAGKTGTAQNPRGEDHAWFMAYAGPPGEAPHIALAVFVENGGSGSSAAGPVAREMIRAAFDLPEDPWM